MKPIYLLFLLPLLMVTFFAGQPCYGQEKVTIDGISYLLEYKEKTAEVTSKKKGKYDGKIIIPSRLIYKNETYIVTKIGNVFYECSNLTSINIPNSVTTIEGCAFYGCSSLTNINIPNSVRAIGNSAFSGCSSLTSINIPNSVTTIENYAFFYCRNLTNINIPNSVTTIGNGAFNGCSNLTNINIPNSVTTIGDWAFYGCSNLTNINIPNSVTSIGKSAFYGCSNLTNINIPSSITKILENTFENCYSLTNIDIPYSINYIGPKAFRNCHRLTNICIPNPAVTTLDNTTFENCNLQIAYLARPCTNSSAFSDKIKKVYLFSLYAGSFIKSQINEWQKRKEYETTAQWRERVTENNRAQKVRELTEQAKTEFIQKVKPQSLHSDVETYDADYGILPIHTDYGEFYFKIDMEEAQRIKANSSSIKLTPEYGINKDTLALASLVLAYGGKTRKSEQTVEISNQELALNLSPLELNFENDESENLVSKKVIVTDNSIDTNIPVAGNENKNTFAVIIGNENYQKVSRVEFAANDANSFAAYCQKTLGLPEKNVRVYKDATFATMLSAIDDIKNITKAYKGDISVIFYYAGHGVPNESSNDAYLLPIDTDGRNTEVCYPLNRLYSELGALDAKSVTVFMDACFSGSERGAGMLMAARGVAIKAKAAAPHGNMIVFSAASGDETAYPYKEKGHGLFTYFLLKKLQETKGDVSLGELGSYIIDNVTKESVVSNGKSQTPTVVPSASVESGWESMRLR